MYLFFLGNYYFFYNRIYYNSNTRCKILKEGNQYGNPLFCSNNNTQAMRIVASKIRYSYDKKKAKKDLGFLMCSTVLIKDPYDYRENIRYLSENCPNEGNILFRKEYIKGNCYSYLKN